MTERQPDGPDLGQVLGMGGDDVRSRLGAPTSERTADRETWLVYSGEDWRLRLRLGGQADELKTVRSWTCKLSRTAADLSTVARNLGLRLEGPIDSPPESAGRLLRCRVVGEAGPASLTATLRDGAIAAITVFDEAPDWVEGAPE